MKDISVKMKERVKLDYGFDVSDCTIIIAGNFVGQNIRVEHWSMNILPTNEATLPTFTCSASKNTNHELTKYC